MKTDWDSAGSNDTNHKTHNQLQKIIKTIVLALCWVCLGLMNEVPGPTLIDLKARLESSYEAVATGIAGRNVGGLIGAVIGGILIDKFGSYCDLMVALGMDLAAATTASIPWIPNTDTLWFLTLFQGIGTGLLDIAGMKLLFNIWLEKSASPMHILHSGYGIGSFIIPLVANPFLAIPMPEFQNNVTNVTAINATQTLGYADNDTTDTILSTTEGIAEDTKYLRASRIEFAYLIPALVSISLSLAFYVYQVKGTCGHPKQDQQNTVKNTDQSKPRSFKEMINPASCTGRGVAYGLQMLVWLFLFYFNCVGGEKVSGTFIRTYSIDHFGFSVDDGSYINTAFWISFTVGRLTGFLTARWIPIRILILLESGGLLISLICNVIFSAKNSLALWIIMPTVAFFAGPCFPSGMGWANRHIEVTGITLTILQLGTSGGAFCYLKLVGYLYDTYGTTSFLYLLVGYGVAFFTVTVMLDLTGKPRIHDPGEISIEDTKKRDETSKSDLEPMEIF